MVILKSFSIYGHMLCSSRRKFAVL